MRNAAHICLSRSEDRKPLPPICISQLDGHWIDLNDDGHVLVAKMKYMTSNEANYSPHPCFMPGLHQTVGPINDSDSTRRLWLSMTKTGPQSYI